MTARILILALLLVGLAGCQSDPPGFDDVAPAEDLYAEGLGILEGRRILGLYTYVNYGEAIETFQSIVDNYPYSEYAVLSELRIADAYFDDRKYEEALSYYRDFADLHPQHPKVPFTIYRSALCYSNRVKSPNRDQTPTREALVYLDRLLASFPHSQEASEAESLWRELRTRLAEQIENIARYYMKREEWESAAERYRTLLNEYPGLGFDARGLYQLGVCYTNMNRAQEAETVFQAVVQNYGDSNVAEDARDRIAKMN